MGRECLFRKLLKQSPEGVAVDAHAALFDHHVALFIKLPHHGMLEALRFEIGPQFEAIDGERVEVLGLVPTGGGVHVLASFAFDDLAKLVAVRRGELVGGRNRVLPGLFELFELLLVAPHGLVALGNVGGIRIFNFHQRNFFASIVARPNRVRSLEGHVLKHVRQAGLAHGILHRSRVHVREERKHRRLGTLADDDGETIGELLDRGALLEGSQILPESNRAEHETDDNCLYRSYAGFHPASTTQHQKFEVTWRQGRLSNSASLIQTCNIPTRRGRRSRQPWAVPPCIQRPAGRQLNSAPRHSHASVPENADRSAPAFALPDPSRSGTRPAHTQESIAVQPYTHRWASPAYRR